MSPELRAFVVRMMIERAARGWSQRELCRRAGVDHAVVSKIESGVRTDMDYGTAARLADALGLQLTMVRPGLALPVVGADPWPELVAHLVALHDQSGLTVSEAASRARLNRRWLGKAQRDASGRVLRSLAAMAAVYGYRLALVPIDGTEGTCET